MLWRLTRAEFERKKGEGNTRAMQAIVTLGEVPGILAFLGDIPIGWCAVAPREDYPALERSRVLKRLDTTPVRSVTCLFVDKRYRCPGISNTADHAMRDHERHAEDDERRTLTPAGNLRRAPRS